MTRLYRFLGSLAILAILITLIVLSFTFIALGIIIFSVIFLYHYIKSKRSRNYGIQFNRERTYEVIDIKRTIE